MSRALMVATLGAVLLGGAGCTTVNSAMPGGANFTGEAWYTENTGFFGLIFSSRV